jgi:AraC-like DNA-binding protein
MQKLGGDVEELFARVGIDPELARDRDARLPFDAWIEMWRLAAEMTGDPALGIHAAEDLEPGVFGVIDYVTRCSGTLGEGIERSCRYYPLIHDAARPAMQKQAGRWVWSYNLLGGLRYPRVLSEYALACWLMSCRQGLENRFDPVEVHFVHNQTVNLAEYERFYRAPVKLGMERDAFIVAEEDLGRNLSGAKQGLCEILDQYAQQLLQKLPANRRFSDRVREIIASELAGGDPSADCIAQKLHMSPRTLRRRLNDEGLNHRVLLEQLRKDLASLYLNEKGLAVSEAAFLLGFADASAFHKAFKRWTGRTPVEYRRETSRRASEPPPPRP